MPSKGFLWAALFLVASLFLVAMPGAPSSDALVPRNLRKPCQARWNPAAEAQAIQRRMLVVFMSTLCPQCKSQKLMSSGAHRIGQVRPVKALRLVAVLSLVVSMDDTPSIWRKEGKDGPQAA